MVFIAKKMVRKKKIVRFMIAFYLFLLFACKGKICKVAFPYFASFEMYISPFGAKAIPSAWGKLSGFMLYPSITLPRLSVITSKLPADDRIYNLLLTGWIAAAEGSNLASSFCTNFLTSAVLIV